jgi:hypothetical protein
LGQGVKAPSPNASLGVERFDGFLASLPFLHSSANRALTRVDDYLFELGDPAADRGPYVRIDERKGLIVATSRQIPTGRVLDGPRIGDDELNAHCRQAALDYLDLLHIQNDEVEISKVTSLLAKQRPIADGAPSELAGKPPITIRELEKLVYVQRSIRGIPVVPSRLVFSFNLDGTLRKVAGRWPKIDYQRSQFVSELSSDADAVQRAVQALVDRRVDPFSAGKIRLFTIYESIPVARGQHLLDLRLIINLAAGEEGPDTVIAIDV